MKRATVGTCAGRRALTVVIAVVGLGLAALAPATVAAAVQTAAPPAAQGQPAPEGFEPVTAVPAQEQLPAAPLVMMAYAFVWVMLVIYVWTLWRRLGRVEKELADVARRVGEGRRS